MTTTGSNVNVAISTATQEQQKIITEIQKQKGDGEYRWLIPSDGSPPILLYFHKTDK